MINNDTIYFDHQATTPIKSEVLEKMRPFFRDKFANPHSSDHWMGWETAEFIRKSIETLSRFCGCDDDEFIFTSGATEANNFAILGVGRGEFPKRKNRILVSAIEHKCVLSACNALNRNLGTVIETIPVDETGAINQSVFCEMMGDDVRLVSVMAANNEIGTLQNMEFIGRVAQEHGALLHCDAAQAPMAMSVPNIFKAADLISLSSHKMYGPKGIGALIVRREHQHSIEPLFYGGDQQNGLRPGTLPTSLCVGFAAAAAELSGEPAQDAINNLRSLRDLFVGLFLESLPSAKLNGPDLNLRHPGNANILLGDQDGSDFLRRLQPKLAASTGSACSSGTIEPSHVLQAIGLSEVEARNSIRFSLGLSSTLDEVERAIEIIRGL